MSIIKHKTFRKEFGAIILNTGCSQHCVFCGKYKPKVTGRELKMQEIEIYKSIQHFKKLGFKNIEISGSDPIEYNKIIELIEYLKKEGFEFIQLSTHGTKLASSVFLNKLISSGIDKLRIPIYGSQAKIHDSITKTPGSFNNLIKGLRQFKQKNNSIELQMSCLITQQNKNDLKNIIDLITYEFKVEDFYFSIPCISYAPGKNFSYYIPIKQLSSYVKKAYEYSLKVNNQIKFYEIPFCVFGKFDIIHINNQIKPPDLSKYQKPPLPIQTSTPNVPAYRLKTKISMCQNCSAFNFCDGFFVNDINQFGTGKLRPLKL